MILDNFLLKIAGKLEYIVLFCVVLEIHGGVGCGFEHRWLG